MRNESGPTCRLKVPMAESYRFMTQFQEMSTNYLTSDNHKSKAYHLHTGRQVTGNANSLKET
jgi:hypothetical protein